MKLLFTLNFLFNGLLLTGLFAQADWPKQVNSSSGATIKMYEWQSESFSGNVLQGRAAIAYQERGQQDPAFGVIWFSADMQEQNIDWLVSRINISSVKLPDETAASHSNEIKSLLEAQINEWRIRISKSKLNEQLKITKEEKAVSNEFNNAPPQITYSQKPAILVNIDGTPKLQVHPDWAVETVVNSPFTIVKHKDGSFFLYGGKHWYRALAATGPYHYTSDVPTALHNIEYAINEAYKKTNTEYEKTDYTISTIIVSTSPTELIQTQGEPKFSAVQGTGLLYISNTEDDIFMDVKTQQYYVLLAGRWYRSRTLSGQWQYVSSEALPSDFAKIPYGSEKESVLASVAGTTAARDAVEEAQIPQTARVDRNAATTSIEYDGEPEFESIEGTRLQYAVNTPYSVLRYRNRYYAVDNGVWFESYSARGPWVVSVERPYEVYLISPRYPVYHVKYVYIYETGPDYVYMGYTPGYLNSYVYGPTIVYGTGYHYRPWRGHRYYARPCTWGYNMRYTPWSGWGFGIDISFGWFRVGIGNYYGYNSWYNSGWWGPSYYRPNYCYRNYDRYDRYRYNNYYVNNTYINYTNNIYNYRRDVRSRDNQRHADYRGRDWVRHEDRRNNDDRFDNRGGNNYNDRGRNNGNYNERNNNNSGGGNGRNNNARIEPPNNRGNGREIERPGREARSGNDNEQRNRNQNPGRIENNRDLRNDPPDVRNRQYDRNTPQNERSGRSSGSGNDNPSPNTNRTPSVERGNGQPPVRESRTREQESGRPTYDNRNNTREPQGRVGGNTPAPQRNYEPSRSSENRSNENRGGNNSGGQGNNNRNNGDRGRRGG